MRAAVIMGRHPKTFTEADIRQLFPPLADIGYPRQKSEMTAKYDIIGNNYAELRSRIIG
jgi:hypothetical protein